jgi:hypothetical protein
MEQGFIAQLANVSSCRNLLLYENQGFVRAIKTKSYSRLAP